MKEIEICLVVVLQFHRSPQISSDLLRSRPYKAGPS